MSNLLHLALEITTVVQLCTAGTAAASAFQDFGTTYVNTCKLTLDSPDMHAVQPLRMYDLFLADAAGSLYPVPVGGHAVVPLHVGS